MLVKKQVLEQLSFGAPVAEAESSQLSQYFFATSQWQRLLSGKYDITIGAKGTGKSALHSLLMQHSMPLSQRRIHILAGDNPSDTAVFRSMPKHIVPSENDFIRAWKFYFLGAIGTICRRLQLRTPASKRFLRTLEGYAILDRRISIRSSIRSFTNLILRIRPKVEFEVDQESGSPTWSAGIELVDSKPLSENLHALDRLLAEASKVLSEGDFEVWVALDRLDEAFASSKVLEARALRALLRVYLDLRHQPHVVLKLFLRSDAWNTILQEGFTAASHIHKKEEIDWDDDSLFNLVVRRLLHNDCIIQFYTTSLEILNSAILQEELFYSVFPDYIDDNEVPTFEWMLQHISDSTGLTAPRELIQLLNSATKQQLKRLEMGRSEPPEERLFDRESIIEACGEVSETRLFQTLYAEWPSIQPWCEVLRGKGPRFKMQELQSLWSKKDKEAIGVAKSLVNLGFFVENHDGVDKTFVVPNLYRPALNLGDIDNGHEAET